MSTPRDDPMTEAERAERERALLAERAERSRGLELRWPEVTTSAPDVDALAVDVVNVGERRWDPTGSAFHAVALLRPESDPDASKGFFFGFVAGSSPAVALDPGEYARVTARIDANHWRDLSPGRYLVDAALAVLDVRTASPFAIELSAEQIAAHQPRFRHAPPPPPAGERTAAARERATMLRTMIAAAERSHEVLDLVRQQPTEQEALVAIADLLECDETGARAVHSTSLLRFSPSSLARMRLELEELEQRLRSAEG
ncbi:hypothetical protein [Agromyces sp. NPDC058110]|uniref:hypothetical protein n=1 Tax=Agromyces sp. NPDC058110 TaxID=3346345 RepID=UPI0036D9AA80